MKVLCVEDGSVNIDTIEGGQLSDGKVLVYKQGAQKPFILDIPDNYANSTTIKELEELKTRLQAVINALKQDRVLDRLSLPDPLSLITRIESILKIINKDCIDYIDIRIKELKDETDSKK